MDKEQIVKDMFAHMGFSQAEIAFEETEEVVKVVVSLPQSESGILIGHRGENIDSLQYLLNIMLNQDAIAFKPVNIDVNDYRKSRHDSLRDMANTAAEKALDSGREILMPPFSANERRIIHEHLADRQDITTYSEGEEPSRRVVVRPMDAE